MKIHAQHRLPVFIALSLAIHLVWFINNQSWSLNPPQQDNGQMAVHIRESRPPGLAQRISPPTKKALSQKSDTLTERKPSKNTEPQKQTNTQAFNQLARAKILGDIKQRLVQNFVYPRLARRQGWQGLVMLGFQVDNVGSIQNIHIKQSSGYAILDDSAIAALNKIGKIGLYKTVFLNQTWQLEIPVIYRLEG